MADRTRAFAWASHPLGPIDHWPDLLMMSVNALLSNSMPAQLFWGPEFYVFYNDAAIPVMGHKHPAALGQTGQQNWSEAWATVGPNLAAVLEQGATIAETNALIPVIREGRLTDVFWTYTYVPVYALDGTVAGVLDTFEDTSAAIERDLLAERLNQVLEDTSDAIMTVDRAWTITYMNPAAKKISYPVQDVTGRDLWVVYPALLNESSPWGAHLRGAMEERVPSTFEEFYPEPLNVWLSIQVQPSKAGITIFFTDVTERRRREIERDRLFKERQRFFTLVEAAQDFIGMCDMQGRPFYGNPAAFRLLGFDSLDEFSADTMGLFYEDDRETVMQEIVPKILSQGHAEREIRFRHFRTGEPVWMSYQAFLLRDANGRPEGFATVSRDLSQQRQAAAALIQTEKLAAVGRLASSIAHEINNPLEAVTNLLYLSRETAGVPAEVSGYLALAEQELKRVSAISSQTLRFHKQSAKPVPCDLEDLLDSVLSIQRARLANARVVVEKRLRTRLAVPCFDGEIRQVFNNLVSNAVDAMSQHGGRLLIRNRESTQWSTGRRGLTVTIADTANGIPEDEVDKIFEPFFTTKGMAGTGLGLWVSKEIVTRHDGELRLRTSSRAGRSGTVFSLFLPLQGVERAHQ